MIHPLIDITKPIRLTDFGKKQIDNNCNFAYYRAMAKELTREENLKRAKLGLREDRGDTLFQQRQHSSGLNSIAFNIPQNETKYSPLTDASHDCKKNKCYGNQHYIRLHDLNKLN